MVAPRARCLFNGLLTSSVSENITYTWLSLKLQALYKTFDQMYIIRCILVYHP
jgi:hypothetical protein